MWLSIVKAINNEINSILFNNNWVLMDLPLVLKPIGCEWVLEKDIKSLDLRLIVKGLKQRENDRFFISIH